MVDALRADRFIVQFEGVFDRDAADSLRGVELEAEPLDDVAGVLWVHELVGATVRDASGTVLGSWRRSRPTRPAT